MSQWPNVCMAKVQTITHNKSSLHTTINALLPNNQSTKDVQFMARIATILIKCDINMREFTNVMRSNKILIFDSFTCLYTHNNDAPKYSGINFVTSLFLNLSDKSVDKILG